MSSICNSRADLDQERSKKVQKSRIWGPAMDIFQRNVVEGHETIVTWMFHRNHSIVQNLYWQLSSAFLFWKSHVLKHTNSQCSITKRWNVTTSIFASLMVLPSPRHRSIYEVFRSSESHDGYANLPNLPTEITEQNSGSHVIFISEYGARHYLEYWFGMAQLRPSRPCRPLFLSRGMPIHSDFSDFRLANSCGNGTYVFEISWMCVSRFPHRGPTNGEWQLRIGCGGYFLCPW
jgi:hypothetical protein